MDRYVFFEKINFLVDSEGKRKRKPDFDRFLL